PLAHIKRVLLPDPTIEPDPGADVGDLLRRGALAEHSQRRIAGNEMDEAEDQYGNAEQDGDDGEASPDGVAPHRSDPLFTGAPQPAGSRPRDGVRRARSSLLHLDGV